jgi:hypothetical protein
MDSILLLAQDPDVQFADPSKFTYPDTITAVQAELAKQYQYGAEIADWQGGAMADVAYNNAMTAANNTATAGYISATGSLLSAAGGFMKPSNTGNFKPVQNVGGQTYYNDPSKGMYVMSAQQ